MAKEAELNERIDKTDEALTRIQEIASSKMSIKQPRRMPTVVPRETPRRKRGFSNKKGTDKFNQSYLVQIPQFDLKKSENIHRRNYPEVQNPDLKEYNKSQCSEISKKNLSNSQLK